MFLLVMVMTQAIFPMNFGEPDKPGKFVIIQQFYEKDDLMKNLFSEQKVAQESLSEQFFDFVEQTKLTTFTGMAAKIAKHMRDFCAFEGHYIEVNPDLVNEEAYFSVLQNDYKKLFEALKLSTDNKNPNAFFERALEVYVENLKNQTNAAKGALEDDQKFSLGIWVSTTSTDFFRDKTFLPNLEQFIRLGYKHQSQKSTHEIMARGKAVQAEYRQQVEANFNTLLYLAWQAADRTSLPNQTKHILTAFPYLHEILKQGLKPEANYDLLITEYAKSKTKKQQEASQLGQVFAAQQSDPTGAILPKRLLPKKKKKKLKIKAKDEVEVNNVEEHKSDDESDDEGDDKTKTLIEPLAYKTTE